LSRVAILAAMAGELKPLVRGWEHERSNGVDVWRWKFEKGEWVAACAGAGVDAVKRAFAAVEKDGAVSAVISTGWVGALSEAFRPGEAYRVTGVIDARTGERFETAEVGDSCDLSPRSQKRDLGHPVRGQADVWLVTSARVADGREKQRLAETYKAGLVDMEAAGVARLAAMRGIPFHGIKGVSDGFKDDLPDFNRFLTAEGHFLLARFILFSVFRPWCWPALLRMGENSSKAAHAIRGSLLANLDPSGVIRNQHGYPNR
jgi:adenosylhomocysteine nucleosidase